MAGKFGIDFSLQDKTFLKGKNRLATKLAEFPNAAVGLSISKLES